MQSTLEKALAKQAQTERFKGWLEESKNISKPLEVKK